MRGDFEDILTLFPVILTTDHVAGCAQEGVRLLRVPSPAGRMLGFVAYTSFLGGVYFSQTQTCNDFFNRNMTVMVKKEVPEEQVNKK